MGVEVVEVKKSKKHKRNKGRVVFDEEIIDKVKATEVLAGINIKSKEENNNEGKFTQLNKKKSKKKDKLRLTSHETNETVTEVVNNNPNNEQKKVKNKRKGEETEVHIKKSKKQKSTVNASDEAELNEETKEQSETPETLSKTEESIRARKRRKHQQLLEEKKKKMLLTSQKNVLNYLSKWKHAKNEWKFEKLKQKWLFDNLFDYSLVPDEFWETTIEYFNGSKGAIRGLIIKKALEIIDVEDKAEEENLDETYQNRLKRARDIVQFLQE